MQQEGWIFIYLFGLFFLVHYFLEGHDPRSRAWGWDGIGGDRNEWERLFSCQERSVCLSHPLVIYRSISRIRSKSNQINDPTNTTEHSTAVEFTKITTQVSRQHRTKQSKTGDEVLMMILMMIVMMHIDADRLHLSATNSSSRVRYQPVKHPSIFTPPSWRYRLDAC